MKKLYVGNLPFKATEQDLIDWFTQAGVTGPPSRWFETKQPDSFGVLVSSK